MNTIDIKRGDTLSLDCTLQQAGAPINLTGWQIASQVRGASGQLVHSFEATITAPAAGQYRLGPVPTGQWPTGGLSMDIRYTDAAGAVFTTQTVPVQVQEAISQ
jgi:hypothetical protein